MENGTQISPAIQHRFIQGDAEVISDIYDAYGATLYGILVKIVHSSDVAEDILQETFARTWEKRSSFDANKATLFTWMLNIGRNLAIDYKRSARSRYETASTEVNNLDDNSEINTSFETVDIDEHVAKLPVEQQKIIQLTYFEGYTQAEIAEEFNIPLGTVKSRLRLAMNSLRTIYGALQ